MMLIALQLYLIQLKQIDFDNKAKHSDIRAVRGEGQ